MPLKRSPPNDTPSSPSDHRDKRLQTSHASTSTSPPPPKRPLFLPSRGTRPQAFNLITALCSHVDILLHVVSHLPPFALVALYSVSAPFHYQFSSHQTLFILAGCRAFCPAAPRLLPWHCFGALCVADPAWRAPTFAKAPWALRRVPGLRWLRMATYRTIVCEEIVAYLAAAGHRLPPAAAVPALLKLWLAMDAPVSTLRVSVFRNTAYVSDRDLFVLQAFLLKLDMYFTDPLCFTGGEVSVRKLLLAEPGLTPLWDALRAGLTRVEGLRLYARHKFTPALRRGPFPEEKRVQETWDNLDAVRVMGVPLMECGRAGLELRGMGTRRLIRPDELVVKEGVRRGLGLETALMRMMRWGSMGPGFEAVRTKRVDELVPSKIWARERVMREKRERERVVRELLEGEEGEWEEESLADLMEIEDDEQEMVDDTESEDEYESSDDMELDGSDRETEVQQLMSMQEALD